MFMWSLCWRLCYYYDDNAITMLFLLCLCLMLTNHLRYSLNIVLAFILSTFVLMHIANILTKYRVGKYWRLEFHGFRRFKILVSTHSFKDNIHLPLHNFFMFKTLYGLHPENYYSWKVRMVWDKRVTKDFHWQFMKMTSIVYLKVLKFFMFF